jgi:predicted nucleic acid-binding protein
MGGSEGLLPSVVCDAGPIIHLDELGCGDLLKDFPQVLVPEAVWGEVTSHRPDALRQEILVKTAPLKLISPQLGALSSLLASHHGELEALQLAESYPGSIFLTDDTAARLAGRSLGLHVHGTIGILVRAIRRKQRTKDAILFVLRSLPNKSTLHIKRTLLDEVIREVQNS